MNWVPTTIELKPRRLTSASAIFCATFAAMPGRSRPMIRTECTLCEALNPT